MKLEAKEVAFRYRREGAFVLQHLNLTVEQGERVGLWAPSGYGKTTLCKLLAGYEKPESGQVLLDGKPVHSWKGYCPVQMIWQHPEYAVDPRWKMKKIVEEAGAVEPHVLEGLGIQPAWMERYPMELSGGELQRFCIARALDARTQFLLCDEISAMLDLITQSQLWGFLLEEAERRKLGMVVVSHSPDLMERVCTRVITLQS